MGEYLIEQHNRFDVARDYYLEAIALNLVLRYDSDFPTGLLFRSFLDGSVHHDYNDVDYFLGRLNETTTGEETIRKVARSFLELAVQNFPLAEYWFHRCSEDVRHRILQVIWNGLRLRKDLNLRGCTNEYVQSMTRFQSLLKRMAGVKSTHGIIGLCAEFSEQTQGMGFLLGHTNQDVCALLIQAAESLKVAETETQYERWRNQVQTAHILIERVLNFEHDYATELWAAYFRPIAHSWRSQIMRELEIRAQQIKPDIVLQLAEPFVSLTDSLLDMGTPRVIIQLKNIGSGTADRVNVRFTSSDGHTLTPRIVDLELEPQETKETYFAVSTTGSDFKFNYTISYYDADRNFCEHPSASPLLVHPIEENLILHGLKNPFIPWNEVTDERMFVGREQILSQVYRVAVEEGGLLMFQGQRRVGKSSILGFLERRLDLVGPAYGLLPVRVSLLDFSGQGPGMLLHSIAGKFKEKARTLLNVTVSMYSEANYEDSYSKSFNELIRSLYDKGIHKIVLMIDEFDVLNDRLERKDPASREPVFPRSFFEYLRGLSKRPGFSLVLTGGEALPVLFERLGEIFNHDRSWRVDYLSPTDSSVEQLIQNEYIKSTLAFSPTAIQTIKESTACNPFFIQMVCRHIVDSAKNKKSKFICELDVEESIDYLCRRTIEANSVMHLYNPPAVTDSLSRALIGLVAELENRTLRPRFVALDHILDEIDPQYTDQAQARLIELVRRQILRRNPREANEFALMIPLFRDWLNVTNTIYADRVPFQRR
jgi:hypothetical protein